MPSYGGASLDLHQSCQKKYYGIQAQLGGKIA